MNKWISVKDRLPESPKTGCVNVIVATYDIERERYHISFAEFQRNNFYDNYNEKMSIDDPYWPITHWMPLPEPPNE
jgi:hypothetical protein